MFGFIREEAEKLGSSGRFGKRIEKFKRRNRKKVFQYKSKKETREEILNCKKQGTTYSNIKGWDDKFLKETENLKKPIIWVNPYIEHHFWWLLHNCVAHMLIGLVPVKWFFDFHDWTSKKLNAL